MAWQIITFKQSWALPQIGAQSLKLRIRDFDLRICEPMYDHKHLR